MNKHLGWTANHPVLFYTVGRVGIVVVIGLGLYLAGFGLLLAAAFGVVLGMPVSFMVLARQRRAFVSHVDSWAARRREEKASLRAALRGDE